MEISDVLKQKIRSFQAWRVRFLSGNIPGRSLQVDAMRGLAILLVALGHSIQTNVTDFDHNVIFRLIYAFHMPLFMFLSGYVSWRNVPINPLKYCWNKFLRLGVPFLSWYFIMYFMFPVNRAIPFYQYWLNLYRSPDYGLWFLWVLFLAQVVVAIIKPFERFIGGLVVVLGYYLVNSIPFNVMGIGMLKWQFTFFFAGYAIARYWPLIKRFEKPVREIALVGFPLLVFFWTRVEGPTFIPFLTRLLSGIPVPDGQRIINFVTSVYTYAVPFLGIAFTYFIVKGMKDIRPYAWLGWLGTVTLDIYVSHQMFLGVPIGDGWIKIYGVAFLAILQSLILSFFFLRRSKTLRFLFLGMSWKDEPKGIFQTIPWKKSGESAREEKGGTVG